MTFFQIALLLYSTLAFCKAPTLQKIYEQHCTQPSDIYEHLPRLREIASECSSAVEIGVREMVSTWGILQGLADTTKPHRSYIGIDLYYPPKTTLQTADLLATKAGILFSFWKGNDMAIDLPETDLLFIDSLHTYCHLTYELEKFSPKVHKYIALHDTSPPWELTDDADYWGDYSEYPPHIDRSKRGLWPAVQDFLANHPNWELHERRTNCHGLTILKRKRCSKMQILYTSALIPQHYERRKAEYIHSLETLKKYGFLSNTYVVESGPPTIFSFFEEHCGHVFYSATNEPSLRNKGVNEARSLRNFCRVHPLDDEEMVVKLTGRYYFASDVFLQYVSTHPELDAVVSSRWGDTSPEFCLQVGCFAMKAKHFKRWLEQLDLQKMELEMLDLEWEFTRFVQSLMKQGAKVDIREKIGVIAEIENGYTEYY